MRIYSLVRYKVFGVPLYIVGLCGCAGVLVDIDHPIAYYLLQNWSGRFLHTPLAIVSGLVLLCVGTLVAGQVVRMVLRKAK